MKVKELIEELKKYNPEDRVFYWGYTDTNYEVEKVEIGKEEFFGKNAIELS